MTNRRSMSDRFSIYLNNRFETPGRQQRVQSRINTFTSVVLRACATLVSVCILWAVLPHLETQWLGVAHSWRATNITRVANGNWQMDVYAIKPWYRANCEYVPGQRITALVMDPNSVPYEGIITFLDDDSPDSTRMVSAQEQYFGRWELDSSPPAPVGSQVLGRVRHDCDLPWITVTNIGPFVMQETPASR